MSEEVKPFSNDIGARQELPLRINLDMDFGEKSKVMEVLNRAFSGSVVDKRTAAAAIREFEGILDDLYTRPPKWEMVTMKRTEVDNMRDVIKAQDKKIKDITERVNRLSYRGDTTNPEPPLPTDKDKRDMERRLYLADSFRAVYDKEWRAAFRELTTILRWRAPEAVYALMRVIRNACDLSINLAEDQMDKLLLCMEDTMVDPVNAGNGGKIKHLFKDHINVYSDGMKVAEKYAIDYRTERAEAAVPAVIEMFMDTKLSTIIESGKLRRDMKAYVERIVELVWLMTSLHPPMRLYWQQQTERVITDFFEFYDRKGDFVNQAVWPAIFMHNTGRLIYKGQVVSM